MVDNNRRNEEMRELVIDPLPLAFGHYLTVEGTDAEGFVWVRNEYGDVVRGSAYHDGDYWKWMQRFLEEFTEKGEAQADDAGLENS
jgi:hypothetical protein